MLQIAVRMNWVLTRVTELNAGDVVKWTRTRTAIVLTKPWYEPLACYRLIAYFLIENKILKLPMHVNETIEKVK
mgnify:CR=1 FL=1